MIGSIVIPAHNEAAVVGRCLEALLTGTEPGEFDVVVVSNGSSDETAAVARQSRHQVRVLELAEASKSAALRAGDQAAHSFPRIYLDADVVLHAAAARKLIERLESGVVAARPPISYNTDRSTWPVRRYFRARSLMPAVNGSLWGAGVYGLSGAGRNRFGEFPTLVADDLWVDRHFDRAEIEVVECEPVVVVVPRTGRDLLHTLRRTYRGKAEPPPEEQSRVEQTRTTPGTMRDLVALFLKGPSSTLDALVYAGFAILGRAQLLFAPRTGRWERDDSSRIDAGMPI